MCEIKKYFHQTPHRQLMLIEPSVTTSRGRRILASTRSRCPRRNPPKASPAGEQHPCRRECAGPSLFIAGVAWQPNEDTRRDPSKRQTDPRGKRPPPCHFAGRF